MHKSMSIKYEPSSAEPIHIFAKQLYVYHSVYDTLLIHLLSGQVKVELRQYGQEVTTTPPHTLNLRTTTLQKCAAVPRRARI